MCALRSFERCAAANNVREEPFTEITSALRAGQRQSAEEAWAANLALRKKVRAKRGDDMHKSTTGALPAAQPQAAAATTVPPSVHSVSTLPCSNGKLVTFVVISPTGCLQVLTGAHYLCMCLCPDELTGDVWAAQGFYSPDLLQAAPGTACAREAQGQQKGVARDPPYGGIAVRTSGKPPADLCLHCLSPQHV